MGLSQKLVIRINKEERTMDMEKLYALHSILVPHKGWITGELHLDDEMVKDLLTKLTEFMMATTVVTKRLALKYPNGFRYFDLPSEDMEAYRNHCQVDEVIDVMHFFKQTIPSKDDDVLVVYAFDS